MWNKGWDDLFSSREWGKYPSEELVRCFFRLLRQVESPSRMRVLELGSGPGANLLMFAREGVETHGVDGSAEAVKIAGARLAAEGLSADLQVRDVARLDYPSDHFDFVVDVECVYANSWQDSLAILKEAHRVLKPGGKLFSQAFATGMSGEDTAVRDPDHHNTILSMPDGPLHSDYGAFRLLSEEEIPLLYGMFDNLSYDYLVRTGGGRRHVIKEWIITGQKQAAR